VVAEAATGLRGAWGPRRAVAAALVLAACLAGLFAAPAARADVGISDGGPGIFADWRFTDLGVRHVRLVVPWDVAVNGPEQTDTYLRAARAAGADVHVAFEHGVADQCPAAPCALPTGVQYREAVQKFRSRWPWVVSFTPWNEATHETQPTARGPGHAALYFDILTEECPGCEIVAADVLGGDPDVPGWLAAFTAAAAHPPALWGLHDYADPDRRSTADLDGLLSLVSGPVWITETGGIVRFRRRDGVETMVYDEARAARALGFALTLADAYAARVPRIYVHSFTGGGRMDTGLVGEDGSTRAGYAVMRDWMRAHAVAPLPRPKGQEQATAPFWDPVAAPTPAGGTAGAGAGSGATHTLPGRPRRVTLRSPRARRVGRRAVRLLLSCPAGGARCTGTIALHSARCAATRFSVAPGARGRLILHCGTRPSRGRQRLTVRQTGTRPWTATVAVR
jgi:hypothetical protein